MFRISEDKIKKDRKLTGYSVIPYYVACKTCRKLDTKDCVKKMIIVNNKINIRKVKMKICKNWEISPTLYKIFRK